MGSAANAAMRSGARRAFEGLWRLTHDSFGEVHQLRTGLDDKMHGLMGRFDHDTGRTAVAGAIAAVLSAALARGLPLGRWGGHYRRACRDVLVRLAGERIKGWRSGEQAEDESQQDSHPAHFLAQCRQHGRHLSRMKVNGALIRQPRVIAFTKYRRVSKAKGGAHIDPADTESCAFCIYQPKAGSRPPSNRSISFEDVVAAKWASRP